MKNTILLIFFFLIINVSMAKAESYDKTIDMGASLSFHPLATKDAVRFSNKVITKDGSFVVNPRMNFNFKKDDNGEYYKKFSIIAFNDCVGSAAIGGSYSFGLLDEHKNFYFGIGGGFYFMDTTEWRKRELPPFWINLGTRFGLVPIFGLEHYFKIIEGKNFNLNTQIFVSPLIVNGLLSLSFNIF